MGDYRKRVKSGIDMARTRAVYPEERFGGTLRRGRGQSRGRPEILEVNGMRDEEDSYGEGFGRARAHRRRGTLPGNQNFMRDDEEDSYGEDWDASRTYGSRNPLARRYEEGYYPVPYPQPSPNASPKKNLKRQTGRRPTKGKKTKVSKNRRPNSALPTHSAKD